ncbi:MAG: hypothetical protein WBD27_05355 [Pyrinomonadaceae bacterium]
MKLIVLAIILTAFILGSSAAAQSVVITPKKVTYKRPKPIQDFKKTFTVTYPKVKASSPALSKKIESTLSYATVLKLNLKEEIGEYQWLEEADYEVGYNKNGLLVITMSMNGTAAYPDGTSKTLVVDLKTGNQLKPVDVFTNLPGLTAMVKKAQDAEMIKAKKEISEDPDSNDLDPKQLFEGTNFTVSDLNEFAVNDKGVTFIYDYSFAHVIQALEPEGRYSFTWDQVKPYIKRSGLLAKFIR